MTGIITGDSSYPPVNFSSNPLVMTGPGTITLGSSYAGGSFAQAYVVLEITPDTFSPDKTIVIPKGSGAGISLESSTNLVDWIAAPPGVYTNAPANMFFRIRADRLN